MARSGELFQRLQTLSVAGRGALYLIAGEFELMRSARKKLKLEV